MCNAMALVSLGVQAAGIGMQAQGIREQYKQQQKLLNYQAHMERIRAGQVDEEAGAENIEAAERRRQLIGSGKVAAVAAGGVLDAGPLDAIQVWEQDAEMLGAYDTARLRRRAELERWGFGESAKMLQWQGGAVRKAGRLQLTGSLISGGAQLGTSAIGAYQAHEMKSLLSEGKPQGGALKRWLVG